MKLPKFLLAACQALAALPLIASATPAQAAVTITTNGSGQITAASGVNVGSTLYNVSFRDGSCNSLFGGCNPSLFAFSTQANALIAAQALLNQVLLNLGPGKQYDSKPWLVQGCSEEVCKILIPYAVSGSNVLDAYALNYENNASDTTGYFSLAKNINTGSSGETNHARTYAVFAKSTAPIQTAVPEPATWLLMITGFALAGFALRRKPTAGQRRVTFA